MRKTQGYALVTVVLWALGYVMTRVAIGHFSPEAMAFLRYFVAALVLIGYALFKKMRLPALRDVPLFLLGGAIGFAVYVYAINTGSQTLSASVVSFLVSSAPVFTALLALFVLREKIGAMGWVSVCVSFLGVGIIAHFSGGLSLNAGALWIVLAAVLHSFYIILQRRLLKKYTPLEITTYCICAGALELSVFAPRAFPQLVTASIPQIGAILVLGALAGAVAYLCWAHALKLATTTGSVTNYLFLTPLLTTLLGFLMIGEAPHPSVYLGGALVLIGVLLINRSGGKGRAS